MDREQPGPDLAAVLAAEGPMEPARAVAIVGRVAPLLDAEAARGVPREITPAEVLLPGEDVRLAVPGTPVEAAGERSDVAALAGVLFACLTGRPPADGAPPSALRPGVPAQLDDVVLRGLARGYPTCGELAAAASAALPAADGTAPTPAHQPDPAADAGRTGRLPLILGAVAVLAVLAVVLVLVLTGGSDDPGAPAAGTTTTSAPTTPPLAADQTDDPAQAQLRAIVPEDWINVDCDRGVLPDDGAIAALGCGPGRSEESPEDSVFYLYPDAATLDAVFLADMDRNGVPPLPEGGACPAVDGHGTYEIDGELAGRFGCFVDDDNNGILVWTRNAGSVEGLVTVMDGGRVGLQVLYDWWVQQDLSDFILP